MDDRTQSEQNGGGDAWAEVGRQFQSLGESMAQAIRAAWENEENQRKLQEMRKGLESMVGEVDKAIRDTAQTEQAQKLKVEAEQTMRKVADAGEKTVQEVRPHLITALKDLNDQLQKFVQRMEADHTASADKQDPPVV